MTYTTRFDLPGVPRAPTPEEMSRELTGDVDLPGGFLWECELAVGFHVPPLLEPEPQLGHLLIAPRRRRQDRGVRRAAANGSSPAVALRPRC
jgi:hypothetical protein